MLSITLVSIFAFISINQASHLQKYYDLIDLNNDGKIFSNELFEFFNKFYEEKQDEFQFTPLQAVQIENNGWRIKNDPLSIL